ncbi:MAG TPA: hypothetical protein VES66_02670 [Terriglobales bacterium]|nr:hypothetical protein [Terriglobales bacterium]
MKRMAWLLVAFMGLAILSYADDTKKDEGKGKAMTGWLCNSKCVKPDAGNNTCDKACTATGGDVVFIDSKGGVSNIANQDMVKSHAGKKVKMMAAMMKDGKTMEVYKVEYAGP